MQLKSNIKNKLSILLFVLLPALLFNTGCASLHSGTDVDPKDKSRSLVFGYFDMSDAPSWGGIDWVTFKQFKPEKKYYQVPVDDGLFFHIGIPKASLQVDSFGRSTRLYSNTVYTYNFASAGRNQTSKKIKKAGIYFLGSYKYKVIDSGSFFKADNFEMVKTKKPSEKKVLKNVLKLMLADRELRQYKYQIKRIRKRLKQLR